MRHIEGKANTVADTLSRGEISAINSPQPSVDYKAMAAAQRADGIWVKTCLRCQATKVHRHTTAPVDQFVPATRRFDHILVDIVGPLPPSHNYRYLLTVVDRFTPMAGSDPTC